MNKRLFAFVGGHIGPWCVTETITLTGDPLLPDVTRINIMADADRQPDYPAGGWVLRGITSNERYVMREEKAALVAKQQGLGRPEATSAALILIRKNADWWALTQDERRQVIEEQSRHINIGLQYLPAIARRLHHCRDLSENEPFDFLTWFEFSPAHKADFNNLLAELRASEEWKYIDREIDIRLMHE